VPIKKLKKAEYRAGSPIFHHRSVGVLLCYVDVYCGVCG